MTFLLPLIFGFTCNLASAFTSLYSRRWGQKPGTIITIILRNVLGIPFWASGFAWAAASPSPALFSNILWIQVSGWILIILGTISIIIALITLRLRAAAPSVNDQLVQKGIYAYVRNPIHTGTILEFIGVILILPTLAVFIACLTGIAWVILQTRFDEYDLLQRMPGYAKYMQQVPRFLPIIHLPGKHK